MQHYPALHHTVLPCITLHGNTLHYFTQHYPALLHTELPCITLHRSTLHSLYTALPCITLYITALIYTALPCITLNVISLYYFTHHYPALLYTDFLKAIYFVETKIILKNHKEMYTFFYNRITINKNNQLKLQFCI